MGKEKDCPEKIYGREDGVTGIPPELNYGEEKFWDDPRNILNLIDLIFLCEEGQERLPRT